MAHGVRGGGIGQVQKATDFAHFALGDLCDQYLDDETATMKLEDLSLDVKQRCLAEGESCRAHTAAGKKNKKKKASSEKKGMFSGFTKMIGLGGDKHGDPWGDGKRDPQPFMEAQWEAFLIVKRSIDQVEWWNSDLHAKYEEDMEKIRAAEVEAIAADILEKQRQENLQRAKEYKAEAVKREKERAEKEAAQRARQRMDAQSQPSPPLVAPAQGGLRFSMNSSSSSHRGAAAPPAAGFGGEGEGGGGGDWPASLRKWVERAFAQCSTDLERSVVTSGMKAKAPQPVFATHI